MCGIEETIGDNLETCIADQMCRKREQAILDWLSDRAAEGLVLSPDDIIIDFLDMRRDEDASDGEKVVFSAKWRIRLRPNFWEERNRELGIEPK